MLNDAEISSKMKTERVCLDWVINKCSLIILVPSGWIGGLEKLIQRLLFKD